MSFAMGTPQPCSKPLPVFTARYTMAGTTAPPAAPKMGSRALRGLRSSPAVSSNFISRPTNRKKMAMRKSLMKCSNVRCGANDPSENPSSNVCQNSAKYGSTGVFSMTSAATAAASMSMVARVDECVNSKSLRLRRWWCRTSGSKMRSVGEQAGSPERQAGPSPSRSILSFPDVIGSSIRKTMRPIPHEPATGKNLRSKQETWLRKQRAALPIIRLYRYNPL